MINIIVNDVKFTQVEHERFVIYGEKNQIYFMESQEWFGFGRIYRSLNFEGKFYAPKIDHCVVENKTNLIL
jgi:hypothetical protein